MPGKNGKGPTGQGQGKGQGCGQGQGNGQGQGQGRGQGQGQGRGQGVAGECLCPQCGKVTQHTAGIPCTDTKCPECGATMIRK